MTKKQLFFLLACSFSTWGVGSGLLPLLPLYAEKVGADHSVIGYYLAFVYFAISAGSLAAGWISERFQRRKLPLLIIGSLAIPVTWLIGMANNIYTVGILTALLWFCGGLDLALVGILTGLSAKGRERGKIFGILSVTNGIGALFSGLASGYMVDHWGYPVMFLIMAATIAITPLAAIFLREVENPTGNQVEGPAQSVSLGRPFFLVFVASLLVSIPGFIVFLVRSLLMSDLGFGATAIASAGAIGSIVTLPLPLLVGWLSDRKGRKLFLSSGYMLAALSAALLAFSSLLWHFWTFSFLQSISSSLTGPVAIALAADVLPAKARGRGLGFFSAANWIGGILGFASGGLLLKNLGLTSTLIVAFILPLLAVGLILSVHPRPLEANPIVPEIANNQQVEPFQAE